MEDAALGLIGGGSGTLISLAYAYWQSKQNAKDIEQLEEKLESSDALIDTVVSAFSNFKLHVAETYVPVGRFVALENKIDKIYEHILKNERT